MPNIVYSPEKNQNKDKQFLFPIVPPVPLRHRSRKQLPMSHLPCEENVEIVYVSF